MQTDPATRAYRDRRLPDPNPRATKTSKDVIRCLNRAIARQIYRTIRHELINGDTAVTP